MSRRAWRSLSPFFLSSLPGNRLRLQGRHQEERGIKSDMGRLHAVMRPTWAALCRESLLKAPPQRTEFAKATGGSAGVCKAAATVPGKSDELRQNGSKDRLPKVQTRTTTPRGERPQLRSSSDQWPARLRGHTSPCGLWCGGQGARVMWRRAAVSLCGDPAALDCRRLVGR